MIYKKVFILKTVTAFSHISIAFKKFGNCTLRLVIQCMPKHCICTSCGSSCPKNTLYIVNATIPTGHKTHKTHKTHNTDKKCKTTPFKSVTEKIRMFINIKWNGMYCDGNGGVRLDEFAKYVNSDIIHITYIKKELSADVLDMSLHKNIIENLKTLTVDFKNNIIYRNLDYTVSEPILFGEIPFL
jgi:hypothetical protein